MWLLGFLVAIFLALTCSVNEVGADKLLFVHAVWRHGDRTPLSTFPNDPHKNRWPMGFGELTNVGAKQHRELGKWLRSRYITQLKFLPTTYNSNYVFIQSTQVNRTIKSAQNNLIGMYNKVPSIYVPNSQSDKISLPLASCRRSIQLKEMMLRTSYYKNYQKQKQMLKGLPISRELRRLWNQIRAAENNNFLLFWGYKVGNYAGQNMRIEIPKSLGGIMLKAMIDRMRDKVQGKIARRYCAYSAHDSTIMSILSTFGFSMYDYNRNLIPSYASVLLFELWERTTDKVPYLKVIYRRDPRHIYDLSKKISGCRNTVRGCTLDQFTRRSSIYVPRNVNAFCATPPRGY